MVLERRNENHRHGITQTLAPSHPPPPPPQKRNTDNKGSKSSANPASLLKIQRKLHSCGSQQSQHFTGGNAATHAHNQAPTVPKKILARCGMLLPLVPLVFTMASGNIRHGSVRMCAAQARGQRVAQIPHHLWCRAPPQKCRDTGRGVPTTGTATLPL